MKFGVLVFPGTTGHHDLKYVIGSILEESCFEIWYTDLDFPVMDGLFIPGGSSFADYLRPGAVAARFPVMESVRKFARKGGLVVGIGNGFQILCEAKMLPGTLLVNKNQRFVNGNFFLKADSYHSCLTTSIQKDKVLKIPVAQGTGRYFASDDELGMLHQNGQILLRYCDENGRTTIYANPDGSMDNIAAICNEQRNVYGIMPHPERACDDETGNTDGRVIFESVIKWLSLHSVLRISH